VNGGVVPQEAKDYTNPILWNSLNMAFPAITIGGHRQKASGGGSLRVTSRNNTREIRKRTQSTSGSSWEAIQHNCFMYSWLENSGNHGNAIWNIKGLFQNRECFMIIKTRHRVKICIANTIQVISVSGNGLRYSQPEQKHQHVSRIL